MTSALKTSRLLLALGALTLAVLAGSLLAHTGTADAHEADTPPDISEEGDDDGRCSDVTLADHEDCVDGKDKTSIEYWHQNYWHPRVCDETGVACGINKDDLNVFEDYPRKWADYTLIYLTPANIVLFNQSLTSYIKSIPPGNHPRSWCGPYSDKSEAANANCGHRNPPHEFFNHQAVPGKTTSTPTHTVFVDEHDHCDDANTVHRNEDGECPTTTMTTCVRCRTHRWCPSTRSVISLRSSSW